MAVKYAGVDLSYANANIDYKELKSGKILGYPVKFAMLRLGHGTNKDRLFDTHYNGCKEAGIYVGAYQWTYALNLQEIRTEADWAVKQLENYNIDYPAALDFEDSSILKANYSKEQYTALCRTWLERIKAANYYPMLYSSPYIIDGYLNIEDLENYDLWLAQYTYEGRQRRYGQTMWQFTVAGNPTLDYRKVGSVQGVPGQCDCNWAYTGFAAKIRKLGMNKPPEKFRVTGTKTVPANEVDAAVDSLEELGFSAAAEKV